MTSTAAAPAPSGPASYCTPLHSPFQPPDLPVCPCTCPVHARLRAFAPAAASPPATLFPAHPGAHSSPAPGLSSQVASSVTPFLAILFTILPHFSPPSSGPNLLHGTCHYVSHSRVAGYHGGLPSGVTVAGCISCLLWCNKSPQNFEASHNTPLLSPNLHVSRLREAQLSGSGLRSQGCLG